MESQEISYVIIGTKQPDLEDVKKKDLNNYLPLWKQEVRDEKGRKRLHGAFKGGFSAGYFNTVGSKEGWTPTQFVSSRSNRQKVSYKPEDFMDEEDLEDFNESKKLATTSNYDIKGSQEELLARKQAILNSEENRNSVFGGLSEKILDDIIIPNTEPIGIRLLKSMGWREGQGIGARVHKKDTDDIYAEKYLFAPKDVAMVSFDQKTNLFGLGFDPYKNAPEFRDNHYTQTKHKPETNKKKTLGFGVGIFEEEDDDIYNYNSMDNFNDTIMDDYEEKIVLGGPKPLNKFRSNSLYDNEINDDLEREELNNNTKTKLQRCSDGSFPISGFVVSSTIEKIGKWFNPPVVPKTFIPYHKFKENQNSKNEANDHNNNNNNNETGRISLTADQRRDILGEEKLKGPTEKTFMSFLSNSDQYKLQNLIDEFTTKRENASKDIQLEIPELKKEIALAALKGFMPFQTMPSKQERYKRFLQVKAGIEKEYLEFPDIYTNKEKNLEYQEFVKAAQIYQPLSNAMASRFTSASSSKDSSSTNNTKDKKKEEIITIVRTVEDWQPSRLLCKRFHIANPHKDTIDSSNNNNNAATTSVDDILDEKTIQRLLNERDRDYGSKRIATIMEKAEEKKQEKEQEQKEGKDNNKEQNNSVITNPYAEDEPLFNEAKNELIVKERPSMDLFNSIFNDSDDEDEESDENENENKKDGEETKSKLPSNTEIITTANYLNKDQDSISQNSNSKDDNQNNNKLTTTTSNTILESTSIENNNPKIKDLSEAFQIIKNRKEKEKEKKSKKHSKSKSKSKSKHSKHHHHHHDSKKRKKDKKRKRHHHHSKKESNKRHKNRHHDEDSYSSSSISSSSSSDSSDSDSDSNTSEEVEWVEKSHESSTQKTASPTSPYHSSLSINSPSTKKLKRSRPSASDFM